MQAPLIRVLRAVQDRDRPARMEAPLNGFQRLAELGEHDDRFAGSIDELDESVHFAVAPRRLVCQTAQLAEKHALAACIQPGVRRERRTLFFSGIVLHVVKAEPGLHPVERIFVL